MKDVGHSNLSQLTCMPLKKAQNDVMVPKLSIHHLHHIGQMFPPVDACSILVDGKDATKINLREAPDSPAEWRKRGKNLMDNKLYGTYALRMRLMMYRHGCIRCHAVDEPSSGGLL